MRPSRSVRRFPVDGGLLLLDCKSNCLFAYNDTARHVWDLIEAGRAEADLISEFAQTWEIHPARARVDIDAIIAAWRGQNVLVDRRRADTIRTARAEPRSAAGAWNDAPKADWASEWICTIRGTPISFALEDALPGSLRLLFAHLETPDAIPQARMEVRSGPIGERVLVEDGRERLRTIDPAEVIGGLFVAVLERTRRDLKWFALIHGAPLRKREEHFGGRPHRPRLRFPG
jgi:hypothetical protein